MVDSKFLSDVSISFYHSSMKEYKTDDSLKLHLSAPWFAYFILTEYNCFLSAGVGYGAGARRGLQNRPGGACRLRWVRFPHNPAK